MGKAKKTRQAPNNIAAARKSFEKRTGQRYTQNDAASDFGVSLSTYRNYEQEHTLPNGGVAANMAKKYGVTVDYLMGKADGIYSVVQFDDDLSNEERELVDLFRELPSPGKRALLNGLRSYVNQK